jgi:hypothetical protein
MNRNQIIILFAIALLKAFLGLYQPTADEAELYHPVNEAEAISADSLLLGDSGTRVFDQSGFSYDKKILF